MTGYDCLVFDLDGTLSDSSTGIVNCINHALDGFGFSIASPGEIIPLIGKALDECFTLLCGEDNPQRLAAMVARYRERYAEKGFMENTLYDGIGDVLAGLDRRQNRMGICTTKKEEYTLQILDYFEIARYFDFVSCGDVDIEKSSQLRELLEAGKISGNSLMTGDRYIDIRAAHVNGLHACGVLWGYGSRGELEVEKPQYLLDLPGAILDLPVQADYPRG